MSVAAESGRGKMLRRAFVVAHPPLACVAPPGIARPSAPPSSPLRHPDTDLKPWGLHLAEHGGKRGKKKAIVAVARKLRILLHRLWATGEAYEPSRNQNLHGSTRSN